MRSRTSSHPSRDFLVSWGLLAVVSVILGYYGSMGIGNGIMEIRLDTLKDFIRSEWDQSRTTQHALTDCQAAVQIQNKVLKAKGDRCRKR